MNKQKSKHSSIFVIAKLIRFNFRKLFANIGVYFIPLMTLLIYSAIALPQLLLKSTPATLIFTQGGVLTYSIIFICSLSYLSYIVNHVFKRGQIDGNFLVIIAKNIKRNTLTTSNFLTLILMIIYFAIFLWIGTFLIMFVDTSSTIMQKLRFSSSLLLACFIIMGIFGGIISFYSIFLSEKLISVVTAIMAVFFPLASITITPLITKSFNVSAQQYSYSKVSINAKDRDDMSISYSGSNVFHLDLSSIDKSGQARDYNDIYKPGIESYKIAVWFDPWYQMSSLYSMFYQNENLAQNKIWYQEDVAFEPSNDSYSITLQNPNTTTEQKYYLLASTEPSNDKNLNNLNFLKSSKGVDFIQFLKGKSSYFDESTLGTKNSFEEQMLLIDWILSSLDPQSLSKGNFDTFWSLITILYEGTLSNISSGTSNWNNIYGAISFPSFQLMQYLIDQGVFTLSTTTKMDFVNSTYDQKDFFSSQLSPQTRLITQNYTFHVFKSKNFIDVKWLILMWGSITILCIGGTYYFYKRVNIY